MSDEFATVLTTGDPGLLAFAQSLLEAAGIEFFVKGENHRNVPFIGFAEVQVSAADADAARALLAGVNPGTDPPPLF